MDERVAVRNSADEEQVRKAKAKDRITDQNELDDLRAVLKTPEGRRYLWGLVRRCGLFSAGRGWDDGEGNRAQDNLHYFEGHRHVALTIWDQILAADPMALLKMQESGIKMEMVRQEKRHGRT